ncbi:restriction endonuclease subunit S, partial [Enterobacter roggenkampii]|nr:restriction endonuclease subunit S [Enterobacter roggenkampii]
MVPKGWITKALELTGVKVIDGDRGKEYPKASDFSGDGYCLFLSAKNVTKYGFQFNELQFIDAEKDKKLRKGRVKRSNIVLTTRGSVGHFAYYDASVPYDVMRINSGMVILDADESDLEPNFLYALCRSFIVQKQIEAASFGSAQPQLTVGIVKGLKLPIPTLVEQKKIAQILSTWDKAISVTEKLLTNSQHQKKALMQQLLTGKKRLQDDNGVRFSGKWNSCLVSDYFDVGSSKRVLQENWQTEGVPFLRTRELVSLSRNEPFRSEIFISDELFFEISQKYQTPKPGDFLVSGVGTLGIHYQVKSGDKFYFKDGNVLWFKLKDGIDSDYFKYCFQSDFIQDQIKAQASITTVGTYTIQNAKKTKFLCPPTFAEQQKIATVLS